MYTAPSDGNILQSKLLNMDHFKTVILQIEIDLTICNCI